MNQEYNFIIIYGIKIHFIRLSQLINSFIFIQKLTKYLNYLLNFISFISFYCVFKKS